MPARGNDTITSGNGLDYLDGGADNDTINTGAGGVYNSGVYYYETVIAGTGNDVVNAQGGLKNINLGDGNDLASFAGNNLNGSIVVGGIGEDTVRANDMSQVTATDGASVNNGYGFGSSSSGVEVLQFATSTSGTIDGRAQNSGQNTNAAGVVTYQFQNNLDGNATLANIVNNANVDFINGNNDLDGEDFTVSNVSNTGAEVVNINVLTSSDNVNPHFESLGTLRTTSNETVNLNAVSQGGPRDTLTISTFASSDTGSFKRSGWL